MYDFTLAECSISLCIMGFVWFHLFRKARIDEFRCKVREIRDGLFDYVWRDGQDFNEPAYRETREMLNGLLRASNHLSLTALVVATAASLREQSVGAARWRAPIPEGPFGDRIRLARSGAATVLFTHVFLKGTTGLFVRALLLLLGVAHLATAFRAWTTGAAEKTVEYLTIPTDHVSPPGPLVHA